jgi:hypothetical protein
MRKVHACVVAVTLLLPVARAGAKEFTVQGEALVPVTSGNPQDIRTKATRAAKRKAVMGAIDQMLGPDASLNPKVAPKIDAIVAQVPDTAVVDQKATRIENNFQVQLRLVLDDKTFRTLLSDQGVAINTTVARGSSMLAIMDEFITTPRDLKVPLAELVEYKSSVGASASDRSSTAVASSSKSLEVSRSVGQAAVFTRGRAGAAAHRTDRGSAEQQTTVGVAQQNVQAETHDDQYYRRLVRYQPPNHSAQKVSQTYNALAGQLQDYDLRLITNNMFRSRYFARPVTLEDMGNGDALAKYVAYARAEAKADFFMVGTSVIIDDGRNPNTGQFSCNGLVSLETFSTQSGESIASGTKAEEASGMNANGCAANVAQKLARSAGAYIGSHVQDYWKRRATYGREYVLTLRGAGMTLGTRVAFAKAVKSLPGVEGTTQRTSNDSTIEMAVTYKGKDPLDQAVAEGLSAHPAFSSLDAVTDGTHIVFCFGPCRAQR